MKRWVGRSVAVIGVLHTIVGGMIFGFVLPGIIESGFFNTVGEGQPDARNAAFWFFFCGFLLILFGGLLDQTERSGTRIPAYVGWGFAAFAVVGAAMMPQSGFWLLLVPVAGIFLQRRSLVRPVATAAGLDLDVLPDSLAVVRLPADAPMPGWLSAGALTSITRTAEETSVVCDASAVPDGVQAECGWRAIAVRGPLDFDLTGLLLSLARPLAETGIPIFALSTYETDYVLVRESALDTALVVLSEAGHRVG
ncbi:MAG: DUF6463 family protein [Coriobacteriia bacterium]|nr:DUF6463 family protein [Coriobacteriia bacterium]